MDGTLVVDEVLEHLRIDLAEAEIALEEVRALGIGFLDEVWRSGFALPHLSTWQDADQPVRLVEPVWQKNDPDPKALACYGVLWQQGPAIDPTRKKMALHFVDGRPVSIITTQLLDMLFEVIQICNTLDLWNYDDLANNMAEAGILEAMPFPAHQIIDVWSDMWLRTQNITPIL